MEVSSKNINGKWWTDSASATSGCTSTSPVGGCAVAYVKYQSIDPTVIGYTCMAAADRLKYWSGVKEPFTNATGTFFNLYSWYCINWCLPNLLILIN